MARYWLFAYQEYDTCGGFNDFVGSFSSMYDAEIFYLKNHNDREWNCWHIFDSREMKVSTGNDMPKDIYLKNKF